jgi:hypothetical protein
LDLVYKYSSWNGFNASIASSLICIRPIDATDQNAYAIPRSSAGTRMRTVVALGKLARNLLQLTMLSIHLSSRVVQIFSLVSAL